MSFNPERLSISDGDDDVSGPEGLDFFKKAMLRESHDAVDPARLERISHAVVAATPATALASAASSTTTAGGAKAASSWLATYVPNILLAVGMIGGMTIVARVQPAPDVSPAVVVVLADEAPVVQAPADVKTFSPSDLPSAPPPVVSAKAPAIAPTTTTTTDEIALLARAHDALRSDPGLALSLCREHETKAKDGQFAQEREAVAIEALVYLNRRAEASKRFRAFEQRYPASSHRVHLESLLAN